MLIGSLALFVEHSMAQGGDKDCEQLKKEITQLQDDLAKETAALGAAEVLHAEAVRAYQEVLKILKKGPPPGIGEQWRSDILDHLSHIGEVQRQAGNEIEAATQAIQALKEEIADLLNKLGNCGEKKTENAPTATPAPSQAPASKTIGMLVPQGTQPTLAALASAGKVKIDSTGTGETIGHIADLKMQNLTDQPLMCAVPPMILESGSGKNQHYACPSGQTVALNPHQTKTVPMNGVCLNRNKPPVEKGVSGDLVINEANPNAPQNPNSHLPPADAGKLLGICTAKYSAADQLQKSGALKNLPYHDPQKRKDIVVQWSTWCDPRISQITGAPPATKEDLKKVVYKQLETKGPMSPETKKKVDQGIDTIFEKVELTTTKAKDLEKPEEILSAPGTTVEETPRAGEPEYLGQTQEKEPTPTPGPASRPNVLYTEIGWDPTAPLKPPEPAPPGTSGTFTNADGTNNQTFHNVASCRTFQVLEYNVQPKDDRAVLALRNSGQCPLHIEFRTPAGGRTRTAPFDVFDVPATGGGAYVLFNLDMPAGVTKMQVKIECRGELTSRCEYKGKFAAGGEKETRRPGTPTRLVEDKVTLLESEVEEPSRSNEPGVSSNCITNGVVLMTVRNSGNKARHIRWTAVNDGDCPFYAFGSTEPGTHYKAVSEIPKQKSKESDELVPTYSSAADGNEMKAEIRPRTTVYIIGQCIGDSKAGAVCKGHLNGTGE